MKSVSRYNKYDSNILYIIPKEYIETLLQKCKWCLKVFLSGGAVSLPCCKKFTSQHNLKKKVKEILEKERDDNSLTVLGILKDKFQNLECLRENTLEFLFHDWKDITFTWYTARSNICKKICLTFQVQIVEAYGFQSMK